MARPRVLLGTIDYAPQTGGVPLLLSSIVDHTQTRVEWRVVTAAPGPTNDHVVRARGLADLARKMHAQRGWLKGGDERHIVSGHVYLGPVAHMLAKTTDSKVSTLAYGRELIPDRPHQRAALATLTSDHRVITISRHSEALLAELGIAEGRRGWIPPELLPQFPSVAPPTEAGPDRGLRLVTVTRLAEGYKNLEVLLRATRVLAADGTVAKLTIVGDGPRRGALEARAVQLGVDDIVDFAGRLDDPDLARVLEAADVGVFASRHAKAEGGFEGFGIVVQELAAAGLPVVVGRAAGAIDAAHEPWGVLVDPDSTSEWVAAIARLADDPVRRRDLAQAAHRWGRQLSSERTAHAYLDALLGVTTAHPPAGDDVAAIAGSR